MSDVGVHSFQIPHEYVQPTRDMVIVRLPMPPKRSKGGIITPDVTRDLMAHNVQAGRIFAMGPIAFLHKINGVEKTQSANIGDWVLFRPFSGTLIQGGRIAVTSGWRYMSSFNDIIGVIPAARMPAPETLDWGLADDPQELPVSKQFDFHNKRA